MYNVNEYVYIYIYMYIISDSRGLTSELNCLGAASAPERMVPTAPRPLWPRRRGYLVPSTWYQYWVRCTRYPVLSDKCLIPSTWNHVYTWHQVLDTKYVAPSYRVLVPSSWCHKRGTKYVVPSIWLLQNELMYISWLVYNLSKINFHASACDNRIQIDIYVSLSLYIYILLYICMYT